MAKRKAKKPRHPAGLNLPLTVPIGIPTYWTAEEALAVFDLIDGLREQICAIYYDELQDAMHRERQPAPAQPIHIDDEDIPF